MGVLLPWKLPQDGKPINMNGNIIITCAIFKLVAASSAKTELGALFLNTKEARVVQPILSKGGQPQPPTPIHIDSTSAVGIINNIIKGQR